MHLINILCLKTLAVVKLVLNQMIRIKNDMLIVIDIYGTHITQNGQMNFMFYRWLNVFSIDFVFGFDGDAKWICLSLSRVINEYTFLMVYCLLLFYYAISAGPYCCMTDLFLLHLRHRIG